VNRALPILALLLVAAAPSGPDDPDLALGKTCAGHPSADQLVRTLPDYAKELVVLWPRAGRQTQDSGCVSVARLTVINHQGVVLTLSVLLYAGSAPELRDYRVLVDATPPRAVLELRPETSRADLRIEIAGAPSTSREGLEGTLEFIDLETLVQKVEAAAAE
jgi:hypothetical protein